MRGSRHFERRAPLNKLFHETRDDRYVLEAALAGKSDILVTSDLSDFNRGDAVELNRADVLLYRTADKTLVIAKPAFAAHWMRQGFVPDADFVETNLMM